MEQDTRSRILNIAVNQAKAGVSISLDSVAAEAGLTKPGVMHYFRTKKALMETLLDVSVERWEQALVVTLGGPIAEASPLARVEAFLDYALQEDFDAFDLVMYSDPRLRTVLLERWNAHVSQWFEIPATGPVDQRARYHAIRLMAEGLWLAKATSAVVPTREELEGIREIAHHLVNS